MLKLFTIIFLTIPNVSISQEFIAAHNIPAKSIIKKTDILVSNSDAPNKVETIVGRELRFAIQRGRPIKTSDLVSPALVNRNDIVTLIYKNNGLTLEAEAKALGRAALGEKIKVMNLSSKSVVWGYVKGPLVVSIAELK